jgi:hypothetical protein
MRLSACGAGKRALPILSFSLAIFQAEVDGVFAVLTFHAEIGRGQARLLHRSDQMPGLNPHLDRHIGHLLNRHDDDLVVPGTAPSPFRYIRSV